MRYRIAALIPDLVNPYHRSTFAGVAAAAEKRGVDLVALVCGGYKRKDYYHYMRNVLFNMIDPDSFDGFIIPFSAISQNVPAAEFKDFISPILVKPCVLVGAPVDGFSSVTPDYADVISKIVRHLFLHHKIEHLVFVGGPENHITTIIKEREIRKVLSVLGISESRLTFFSNSLNPGTTAQLVEKCDNLGLIKSRNALVFSGEEMALRTITELKLRGYLVPQDVIVCGTSESINSRRAHPSLTTVDNQFEEIGSQSVENLLGMIKGDNPGQVIVYSSELVLRGSCGCIPTDDEDAFSIERILTVASKIENHEIPDDHCGDDLYNMLNERYPLEKNRLFCSALEMSLRGHHKYIETFADSVFYDHLYHFRRIGNSLVSDFNFNELFGKGDDKFAVKSCFLSEFVAGTPESGKLKLIEGYQENNIVRIDSERMEFDSKDFFPKEFYPKERSLLIVEPVFNKQEHLGIMVIEYEKPDMFIHEALRVQISSVMKNRKLYKDICDAEKKFYDMAQISSDWLWEIDTAGTLVYSAGGMRSVPGFNPLEMVGKSFFECIQSVRPGENELLKKMILEKQDSVQRIEVECRSSGGERVVFELSGKPLYDGKGVFMRYRGGCKDITDSKIAGEKMSQLLGEKETLIRELYHRTKNNMQVISSFMGLQSSITADSAVSSIFKEMQNRIFAMSLVHEKLYQSKDLSHINLCEYIKDLSLLLVDGCQKDNNHISLEYENMQDVFVLIDTAIPCGMIVNELITNSLKHAFVDSRPGKIIVGLTKNEQDVIVLKVGDNGTGVVPDFDFRKQSGMGLTVAFALAEKQLDAEVLIDKKNGVSFEIRFKEIYYSQRI
jgi:PAS domain S-box-containing protein